MWKDAEHSTDIRYELGLEEATAQSVYVQVRFQDDPPDLFHELDLSVYEYQLYKKKNSTSSTSPPSATATSCTCGSSKAARQTAPCGCEVFRKRGGRG